MDDDEDQRDDRNTEIANASPDLGTEGKDEDLDAVNEADDGAGDVAEQAEDVHYSLCLAVRLQGE
jgi:hypothetical protein